MINFEQYFTQASHNWRNLSLICILVPLCRKVLAWETNYAEWRVDHRKYVSEMVRRSLPASLISDWPSWLNDMADSRHKSRRVRKTSPMRPSATRREEKAKAQWRNKNTVTAKDKGAFLWRKRLTRDSYSNILKVTSLFQTSNALSKGRCGMNRGE